MNPKNYFILTIIASILFTVFFYEKDWGLNLFLFQLFILVGLAYQVKFKLTLLNKWLFGASLITATQAFIFHQSWSFFTSWVCILLTASAIKNNQVKAVYHLLWSFFAKFYKALSSFIGDCVIALQKVGIKKHFIVKLAKFAVPTIIIFVFLIIYSVANPGFSQLTENFFRTVLNTLNKIIEAIGMPLIGTFLCGLVLSIIIFYQPVNQYLQEKQTHLSDWLTRTRIKKYPVKPLALKREMQSGTFLLLSLNILLFILLFFEIKEVWLNFSFNGQYLKSFVHEGITLLLISILISMLISLYFWRGNQNFYSKSKVLKLLTFIWLILNGLLVVSVAVRNQFYITHFALAYKRIALLFFLLLCLSGLLSIFLKISKLKSSYFLLKFNSLMVVVVFVVSGFINWDNFIAQYNLNPNRKSFVHLDFLASLSDKALPYLQQSPEELKQMELQSKIKIRAESSHYNKHYLPAEKFEERINRRVNVFLTNWESKSILEWNPAEAIAYHKLKNRQTTNGQLSEVATKSSPTKKQPN